MRKRQPNYRRVKIHRTYSVEDITCLFGTHKNTVRAWLKAGLPTCDAKRPVLVLGTDLVSFLKVRCAKRKQPCANGEIYCVRCRAPKAPAGEMVEYSAETPTLGVLRGICPDCHCMINRRVSSTKLEVVCGKLFVSVTKAQCQVSNRDEPSLNSDLRKEA